MPGDSIRLRSLTFLLPLAFVVGFAQPPATAPSRDQVTPHPPALPSHVFGFRDFTQQSSWDSQFLAVPDPALAREHLKTLTAAPHWASSPEDYATALYVADRFKAAGLQTEIVPYNVLTAKPASTVIEATDAAGHRILTGPTASPGDPRILPPFNAWSASGDVTALVVYANYGRLADFQQLAELGVNVKDKIVLVRNGGNYRGVKVYIAQQRGAKGVLIYSDPSDDGSHTGHPYPDGPYRPDSDAQFGSISFLPIYPGDPTTPGIASVPTLPSADRIPTNKLQNDLPSIPVAPLSAADAAPILHALGGLSTPRDWQGGLAFPYHLGDTAAPVTLHMHIVQDASFRTIWDVIGKIPGSSEPSQWVVAGNHRDAWVYGAGDPSSGTAAMLEAVHGLGVLLQHGWKPKRTIVVASWDAEEEGLIGSTEWVEQNETTTSPSAESHHTIAYFNVDVAVSGPTFTAAAVPSLRQFVQEATQEVPSPAGGTVFQQWKNGEDYARQARAASTSATPDTPHVGELGSGSDYTPFLQHAGIPATDIGSDGTFGVYHTVDDSFDWFTRFADPTFAYTQQQARIFGLELIHMADADVLPFDHQAYARAIFNYLVQARTRAALTGLKLDFAPVLTAAGNFEAAAHAIYQRQLAPPANVAVLNRALSSVDEALLIPAGLPRRPWYRHSIYAPGEFTGYEAVVIPGVNEAIDASDAPRAQAQLEALTQAITRAASALTSATP